MISNLDSKFSAVGKMVYLRFLPIPILLVLLLSHSVLAVDADEEQVPIFSVHVIKGLNSSGLEFSPVVLDDKLIFVAERDIDLINYGETGFRKKSYLTIQYSTIKTTNDSTSYSHPRLFSGRISQLQHSGPISFDDSGKFAVFTRVQYFRIGEERIYRPQLFSTRLEKNKWREIEMLNINNPQYSYGHPALSSDGQSLYFVSDREGGFGGKDIYISKNENGTWSEPVNLGPKVNTAGNEAFPFMYKDSLFFFSSDGHPGYGGLDLHYSLMKEGTITTVTHLDSSINSSADDFGFFLNSGQKTGYFSSNRNPNQKDDIYGFSMKWMKPSEMPVSIKGIFQYQTLNGKSLDSLRVFLVNDLGEEIYFDYTDKNGNFEFSNLPYDHNFVIQTDAGNDDLVMILLDDNGKIIAELAVNDKGEFIYKKLSYKEMGGLQFLYSADSLGLVDHESTKTLSGKVDYSTLPYKSGEGMKVFLINEAGDIIYTAIVDKDGNFDFKSLPYDANYIIMTEAYDPDMTLLIFNEGEVVAELRSNPSGEFLYVKLPHSAANTLALMNVSEGEDLLLFRGYESDNWLQDQNSVAVASADNQTAYVYQTLGLKSQGSLMALEGSVSGFCPDTYDQTSEETEECIEMTIDELLSEIAEINTPMVEPDLIEMSPPVVVEPKLNSGIETIYFDKNSSFFTSKDSITLGKIFEILNSESSLQLESNGYSDEAGEAEYNMWMSERRAQRVAEYLIFRGISPSRIKTKGWGEAGRISKCTECSVEQLRVDRRAEIKIF